MEKAYDHKKFEDEIYKKWEKSGAFTPKIEKDKSPFVISMPPANVTGKLHIGHALGTTLEDIMIRYNRMRGVPSLWIPGTDHAGIATQAVVEKQLLKEGHRRHDLGREKFIERVWQWKEEYGSTITSQIRKIGASCDWTREKFTLDEDLTLAVTEAFVDFYNKGLIYRGEYIVNWCPKCGTAISDDEVEHSEQKAKLYYFKYDKNFPITIATTRPETKLGDTAVAVNSNDSRYKEFVGPKGAPLGGKEFDINLDGIKRKIKVIADRTIDKDFGTGAVGVTPSHSMIDWRLAEKYDLEKIKVINERGRIINTNEKYDGLKVLEAREKLVEYLKKEGLLEKEEAFENNLSICYRCNGSIEPLPSLQWFVKMKPLAEKAKKAVEDGEIKIMPKRFEKVYFHWMDNIRDWCISRQLWWGHRLPVWYRREAISNSQFSISNQAPNSKDSNLENSDLDIVSSFARSIATQGDLSLSKIDIRASNLKSMGFAESVVPQLYEGKTQTWRVRDHKLKVGDKVYFENSQSGEIFGFGTIAMSEKKKVKDLPLQEKAHGATYKNVDELIVAFKKYNPEKKITPESDAWIYGYEFVPKEKFGKQDVIASEQLMSLRATAKQSQSQIATPSTARNDTDSEIYVGIEPPEGEGWVQDEDVLDTWFSSGLWPFSTLGWPHSAKASRGAAPSDYDYFFPTTVLETGYDILFFWVARMIMMSLELTGKAPFKTVYLHGLVRDEQNRKMSKSLGNIIDPLDVIEKYGADALRFSLVVGATPGQDMALGESKIKGYRNFSNKIWNISRFVISNLESTKSEIPASPVFDSEAQTRGAGGRNPKQAPNSKDSNLENSDLDIVSKFDIRASDLSEQDKKDLEKLDELVKEVTKLIGDFQFSRAGELLYEYTWHEFADKIIEESKERIFGEDEKEKQASLLKLTKILITILKLLHPYMPYVTEAIWDQLPEKTKDSKLLISSVWPS